MLYTTHFKELPLISSIKPEIFVRLKTKLILNKKYSTKNTEIGSQISAKEIYHVHYKE